MTTNFETFGCKIEDFVASVKDSVTYMLPNGVDKVVISLMSDAQELMELNQLDYARQTLNRAKYLLVLKNDGEL